MKRVRKLVEVLVLAETPDRLIQGSFAFPDETGVDDDLEITGELFWGLCAGLLERVPEGVPFTLSVFAGEFTLYGKENLGLLRMRQHLALNKYRNVYTWTDGLKYTEGGLHRGQE